MAREIPSDKQGNQNKELPDKFRPIDIKNFRNQDGSTTTVVTVQESGGILNPIIAEDLKGDETQALRAAQERIAREYGTRKDSREGSNL